MKNSTHSIKLAKSDGFEQHNITRTNFSTSKQIAFFWLLTAVFLLSACQNQPVFQAYDGPPKPDDQIASIVVPENFDLSFVDGKPYSHSFVVDGVIVRLLPGKHDLVVKYLDYWDINADNHERIESQPVMLSFSVEAGKRYRISSGPLKNIAEARSFAKNPAVSIVDDSTKQALAIEIKTQLDNRSFIASFNNSPADKPPMSNNQTPTPALEMLKYWWQQADAEQQQNFLQWIK